MSAGDVAVLVAAACAAFAAVAVLVVMVVLCRRVRDLRRLVADLERETVPLVREARLVVDQASSEMTRVGDVLGSAEAVSATVDSASRLAYRAFSNPVVKVLAFGTGVGGAVRRLFGRGVPEADIRRLPSANGHRPAGLPPAPGGRATRHRRAGVRR
jgi:hypothetical protein